MHKRKSLSGAGVATAVAPFGTMAQEDGALSTEAQQIVARQGRGPGSGDVAAGAVLPPIAGITHEGDDFLRRAANEPARQVENADAVDLLTRVVLFDGHDEAEEQGCPTANRAGSPCHDMVGRLEILADRSSSLAVMKGSTGREYADDRSFVVAEQLNGIAT